MFTGEVRTTKTGQQKAQGWLSVYKENAEEMQKELRPFKNEFNKAKRTVGKRMCHKLKIQKQFIKFIKLPKKIILAPNLFIVILYRMRIN